MARIGMLLAGCGSLDGSDPLQVAAFRVQLERLGQDVLPVAPDLEQRECIDPIGGTPLPGRRILSEAARLCAGECSDLDGVDREQLDALVVPGGMGLVTTLCDVARTPRARIDETTAHWIRDFVDSRRPLALVDEAVALAAMACETPELRLAVGADQVLRDAVRDYGHEAVEESAVVVEDRGGTLLSARTAAGPAAAPAWALVEELCGRLVERLSERAGR